MATKCMYHKDCLTSMYAKYKQILADQQEENRVCPYGRYKVLLKIYFLFAFNFFKKGAVLFDFY